MDTSVQTNYFPNRLHQRDTLSKASLVNDKQDCFIALSRAHLIQEPLTFPFFFFFFWTNMSHRKNKHRIKVLPWSDPPPSTPEVTGSHTLNLDYTHFAHTCVCFDTIIPTTKWQAETTPGLKIPYVIHFPHKWSLFTLELSPPFGIHNMHRALLKLARVAPPPHVVFDGEMEALFWYLQRFHLHATTAAPTACRPLTACTIFWFTNVPDSLQM